MKNILLEFLSSKSEKSSGRLIALIIGLILSICFIVDMIINKHANVNYAGVLAGYGITLYGSSKGLDILNKQQQDQQDQSQPQPQPQQDQPQQNN
jgi:hypothetical protein